MKKKQSFFAACIILACTLIIHGCHTQFQNALHDATPPGFIQVVAQLEAPNPPNPRAEFDISKIDVVERSIGSDRKIRIIATGADPESGIKSITIIGRLSWRCSFGPRRENEIIGIWQDTDLVFTPIVQPSNPRTPYIIDISADPIAQTGCSRLRPGQGPIFISGFVRVILTNGNGLTTTSKTFIFEYLNIGATN
ncbi:MAG: hypothetical protein WCF67_11435 [Chitinophagaceae bacterium]